jgi:hypothetical protein
VEVERTVDVVEEGFDRLGAVSVLFVVVAHSCRVNM